MEGADVVRIGRGPTPMLYYAAATLGVDGGVMVTGSHNPPDYNGFKFVFQGKSFYGAAIQKLGETAGRLGAPRGERGRVEERAIREDYVARLARDYHGDRPLTVAWDPGNGATGDVVQQLTARLPGRHILLNETIDGTFPAHHPDPTIPENLVQLQAGRGARALRSRHRLRRRRRPHRRRRLARPDPVGRSADGGAGARCAEPASRARRSLPM